MRKLNDLTYLNVLCLTLSVVLSMGCSKTNLKPEDKPVICPSTAFIQVDEYKISPLQDNSDNEFHRAAGEAAEQRGVFRRAYIDLRECWDEYHKEK